MTAFLKEIEPFRGTGEKNEDGLTLEDFLEKYNAEKYRKPSVTADILVFSYQKADNDWKRNLKLLMIKRKNHPSIGFWALPGGFANMEEDLEETAKRELEEETSVKNLSFIQLYTYGEYNRDPRDRVITTAYVSVVEEGCITAKAGDDAKEAEWWSLNIRCEEQIGNRSSSVRHNIYYLTLKTDDGKQELSAVVSEYIRMDSMLKKKNYVVDKNKGIAFDHARYIVMAYIFLEENL